MFVDANLYDSFFKQVCENVEFKYEIAASISLSEKEKALMIKDRKTISIACKFFKNWLVAKLNIFKFIKIFAAKINVKMNKFVIVYEIIKVKFN